MLDGRIGEQEGGEKKKKHKIALMEEGKSEHRRQFLQMRSITSTNHR